MFLDLGGQYNYYSTSMCILLWHVSIEAKRATPAAWRNTVSSIPRGDRDSFLVEEGENTISDTSFAVGCLKYGEMTWRDRFSSFQPPITSYKRTLRHSQIGDDHVTISNIEFGTSKCHPMTYQTTSGRVYVPYSDQNRQHIIAPPRDKIKITSCSGEKWG